MPECSSEERRGMVVAAAIVGGLIGTKVIRPWDTTMAAFVLVVIFAYLGIEVTGDPWLVVAACSSGLFDLGLFAIGIVGGVIGYYANK